MAYKFISLLVVAFTLVNTEGASLKKTTKDERIAALYVKDGNSGELRFMGGGGFVGVGNSNAQINQYITQKQNMLEQLRPTTTSGLGTGITGTGITGTGITGTGSTGTGITGTGISGTGIGTGSVAPIIINAGGASGSASNTAANAAIVGASPIAGLLPQIVAQAALTRRGTNNNRRRGNQRRRNNRRRPNKGGNRKGAHIYVIRPRA